MSRVHDADTARESRVRTLRSDDIPLLPDDCDPYDCSTLTSTMMFATMRHRYAQMRVMPQLRGKW